MICVWFLQFRLKACGLKHVIYLVENYGSMQHMVIPESTLKQAIVNSQVRYLEALYMKTRYEVAEWLIQSSSGD